MICFLKDTIESSLALKSRIQAGLRDGLIRIRNQMGEVKQTGLIQITVKVHMKGLREDSGECIRTDIEFRCNRGK